MRIISLAPAITEILVRLGLEDEIAGATRFCTLWLDKRPEIVIEDYLRISFEKLKFLRPDLVFFQSGVQEKAYEDARLAGLNSHLIPLPRTVYGILENISSIGSIVGRYLEAKKLIASLLENLEKIRENVEGCLDERTRIYVEYLWPDWSYCTAGSLSFVDDGIWWAGGINIFHDRSQSFFISLNREILERSPELVLVNIRPEMQVEVEEYLARRGLRLDKTTIKLIPEGREVSLAHPGPAFIQTINWISDFLREV